MKTQFKVTVNERLPNGKIKRISKDFDGVLIVGSNVQEGKNDVLYEGDNWPLMSAGLAVERVCKGHDKEFIIKIKGHINLVLDDLLERADASYHE